jgi:hypothetical protein
MEADMRNDTTVFVGLDVHKDSIVAAYSIGAGDIQDLGDVGVLQRDLDRLCIRMRSKGSSLRFVYEAGPCGYAVYRHLTAKGFDCAVYAPSLIARKPRDRVKTDRRDARVLVKALRMNDLSAVHVPDSADEAFRDLVRAWGAAKQDLPGSIAIPRKSARVSASATTESPGSSSTAPGTRSCVCANAFASSPRAANRTAWRWWRSPASFPASSGTLHG